MRRTLLPLLRSLTAVAGLGAQQRGDPRALRREVAALRLRAMLGAAPTRSAPCFAGIGASAAVPPFRPPLRSGRQLYLPLTDGVDLRAGVEWMAPDPRGSVGIRLRF